MSTPFDGFAQSYKRYRRYRATLGELKHLGDRELLDLGINRSDLRSIARKSAYGG